MRTGFLDLNRAKTKVNERTVNVEQGITVTVVVEIR